MQQWRGPQRVSVKAKARAWLRAAPRTNAQLAALLNISYHHAATLRYQIGRERT